MGAFSVYSHGAPDSVLSCFVGSMLADVNDGAVRSALGVVYNHPLSGVLMDHQVKAAAFLGSRDGAILADDMGLGKTRSALVGMAVFGNLPLCVVCPANLRESWRDEIMSIFPSAKVSLPNATADMDGNCDYCVLSFSRLRSFLNADFTRFRALIVDEAQGFKNEARLYGRRKAEMVNAFRGGEAFAAHRTQVLFAIAEHFDRIYCLTGTPVTSRPRELFNLLALIRHPLGKNFITYATRYCDGKRTAYGFSADGSSNLFELRDKLVNVVLRRSKGSVLRLPPKVIHRIPMQMSPSSKLEYGSAWSRYLATLVCDSKKRRNVVAARHLVELNLLRQICSLAKVEYVVDRVCAFPGKSVVFTSYSRSLSAVRSSLAKSHVGAVTYNGGMSEKEKHSAVNKFMSDPDVRVFVANIEAAKTGLTLTKATQSFFLDYPWTPADLHQAQDRTYRIGQTQPVAIYYPFFPNTIDEAMLDILTSKMSVISKIFEVDTPVDGEVEKTIQADVEKALHAMVSAASAGTSLF